MPDTAIIRPLQRTGHFTVFDNLFIDALMPALSDSAWKIFCLLLRQTKGWQRESAQISYADISEQTGVQSRTTVKKALDELADMQLIVIHETRKRKANAYGLNRDFEIQVDRDDRGLYRARGFDTKGSPIVDIRVPFRYIQEPTVSAISTDSSSRPTLTGLRRAIEKEAEASNNRVATVRNTMALVYGSDSLPSYKEIGGWAKQVGGAERAVRLIFRYSCADVRGNPVHYIAAAEARRRRAEQGELEGESMDIGDPEHLSVYTYDEYRHFLERGVPKDHFTGAGHDLYRYIDPETTPEE